MNAIVRQSGLTLLEVMVALFIFAVTGSAIMKAAAEHLNGVGQIEEVAIATWVANNHINELMLTRSWPLKNNQKGQQDMAGRTWYWRQTVKATADNDLKAVEVSVSLNQAHNNAVTSVVVYLAKPNVGNS